MASAASMPAYLLPGAPVHQPSHLEGDASLATEILPGPPPLVSAQQSTQKRDPRKSSISLSYLPPSDPGSTYSGLMHGAALISQELEGSRTKRTRVDKSSTTGRAQRASARHQNGALSATLDPVLLVEAHTPNKVTPIETDAEMIPDDEPTFSRSTSSLNLPELLPTTRTRRKDKGKAKDVEAMVKVKEEPKSISLLSPEPTGNLLHNDDHCSSCRSQGSLIYCDGCPRAFHLWCLDPPMEHIDEGDSRWYCPSCTIKKNPPRKPGPSLLAALVHHVETSIPTEFQLPDEVRSFFRDVGTGPKGAYIDTSEVKQPKLNRHGQLEDREPHRLRDRNGTPILCFRCGTSALPLGVAATGPAAKRARRSVSKADSPDSWRSMISCDYCNLHWHLDCLDPPLSAMPPFSKKWMCPNHAERVLPFKRRIPKQNAPAIEITGPRQFNNGNIEVIHPEAAPIHTTSKMVVDEVLINGRRYRVPERILVLDFWNKISLIKNPIAKDLDNGSGLSSPLTSLSSLDDLDEPPETQIPDPEALRVAQTLCLFKAGQGPFKPAKKVIDIATQTGEESDASSRMRLTRMPRPPAINKRATKASNINGTTRRGVGSNSEPANTSVSVPVVRRRRSAVQVPTEPSTRELRPRSKHESSLTSLSSRNSQKRAEDSGQDGAIQDSGARSKPVNIKLEESDFSPLIANIPSGDTMQSLSANPLKPTTIVVRRARTRKTLQKEPEDGRKVERRGRKRKERDDDVPEKGEQEVLSGNTQRPEPEKRGRDKAEEVKRVSRAPPRRQSQSSPLTSVVSHPAATLLASSIPSAPATPSLKIRLPPRLSNTRPSNGSPKLGGAISSANDTPSKL